jgi:tRNA(fMet)-specific endonuclease VapC
MAYLVDSDVVIDFLADDPQTIALFNTLSPIGISVSIISYMETYQGVIDNGLSQEDQDKFNAFFAGVPVLPISPQIAIGCAHLRSAIKQQGKSTRRRALDLLIAATALEHGLELVTHNEDDYKDILNLKRYQW